MTALVTGEFDTFAGQEEGSQIGASNSMKSSDDLDWFQLEGDRASVCNRYGSWSPCETNTKPKPKPKASNPPPRPPRGPTVATGLGDSGDDGKRDGSEAVSDYHGEVSIADHMRLGRNPRLRRRADTALPFIESHTD